MAHWTRLVTKNDYKTALARVDKLIDTRRTDTLQNELMLLSYLIEEYERDHMPIPEASPQEVIRYALEMRGLKQKDLIPILGSKSNVSKVLNGSIKLKTDQLHILSTFLNIPVDALIPRYESIVARSQRQSLANEPAIQIGRNSMPRRAAAKKRGV